MREIVKHAAKIGILLSRNRRGTQVGVIQYPIWQQVGPALPKRGDVDGMVAANMRDVDPYWNGYMERSHEYRSTARCATSGELLSPTRKPVDAGIP